MCLLNSQNCSKPSGECSCNKQQHKTAFEKFQKPQSPCQVFMPVPTQPMMVPVQLYNIILQQNLYIKNLAEQTQMLANRLNTICNNIETRSAPEIPAAAIQSNNDLLSLEKLQDILTAENQEFSYQLQLTSPVPDPAYKERAFSLTFQIKTVSGENVTLPYWVNFQIMLFTNEIPPKLLQSNTAGDKIIRGSVSKSANSLLEFPKIVIKEVTSHFRNGGLFLVVMAPQNHSIKPFIIENFVIKARKAQHSNKTNKKQKLSDD